MALYQLRKAKDPRTGRMIGVGPWWVDFTYQGQRVRESTGTNLKGVAREYEQDRRRELEQHYATGAPIADRRQRVQRVAEIVDAYLPKFCQDHSGRTNSIIFETNRLAVVKRILGARLRSELTDAVIRGYFDTREAEDVSGRTINAEIEALCRAIGTPWKTLWPKLPKRTENEDVGRALEPEEITRLLATADSKPRWKWAAFILRVLLQTGMRPDELLSATWAQLDLRVGTFTVGKAKTKAGSRRQIPLSASLRDLFLAHRAMCEKRFGPIQPHWFIMPAGKPQPHDVTRPCCSIESSWREIRKTAGVQCRLYDCRHTACSVMGEANMPDATIMAIMGHVSASMLERYSHSRREMKRQAIESLSAATPAPAAHVNISTKITPISRLG